MAIAYDSTAAGGVGGASSLTFSHTCSGSNRILVVGILVDNITYADLVSSVTYAGTAMSRIGLQDANTSLTGETLYLYSLVNPASGANNVVITCSVLPTYYIGGMSLSYTGAAQSGTTIDGFNSDNNAGLGNITSETVAVTTTVDNDWLVGIFRNGQTTNSAGANTVLRNTGSAAAFDGGDSNSDQTPAGSHSLTTTFASAVRITTLVTAIAPATATANTSNFFMLLAE